MSAIKKAIYQLRGILHRVAPEEQFRKSDPVIKSVFVQICTFRTSHGENLSIQINPFHARPVKIFQSHPDSNPKIACHLFYPSIIPTFLNHLITIYQHIRPTCGWDPAYFSGEADQSFRILKTGMGEFEFVPIHGDPRHLLEVISPDGQSLVIAQNELRKLVWGLLKALEALKQMLPLDRQVELICGCATDDQFICTPAQEEW